MLRSGEAPHMCQSVTPLLSRVDTACVAAASATTIQIFRDISLTARDPSILVDADVVELDVRDSVAVEAGRSLLVANLVDLLDGPRGRFRSAGLPHFALRERRAIRAVFDAELHVVPRVRLGLERHA